MEVFQPESPQLFNPATARVINRSFEQRPEMMPFTIDLSQMYAQRQYVPIQPQKTNNNLAIVAVVSLIGLFGLIAFLAFLRR